MSDWLPVLLAILGLVVVGVVCIWAIVAWAFVKLIAGMNRLLRHPDDPR